MSLGGPSGIGGPPLPPVGAPESLSRLLGQGWVAARVTAILANDTVRLATNIGSLSLTMEQVPFAIGTALQLRVDPHSGQVQVKPLTPLALPTAAAPAAAAEAQLAAEPSSQPLPFAGGPSLSSAVLAGLQPVLPGSGWVGAIPLGAPQPDALLYSLLAAAFPAAVASGRLRRPQARRNPHLRGYRSPEEPTAAEPLPPVTPYFDPPKPDPEPVEAGWEEPEEVVWLDPGPVQPPALDGEPTEDMPGSRAQVELVLAGAGRVQLDAHMTEGRIRVGVHSEGPLPPALRERVRAAAEALAKSWQAPLDLAWNEAPGAVAF